MFELDRWQEILHTMRKHKLRTALTAFGVFWGIFMLVILLGAGNGLRNGVSAQFRGDAYNSLWLWGNRTSLPYQGLPRDRNVQLDLDDERRLQQSLKGQVGQVVKRTSLRGTYVVRQGTHYASFEVHFTEPDYLYIKEVRFPYGRFINNRDLTERRKVAVLGEEAFRILFPDKKDPVGKYVEVKGVPFLVVGVHASVTGSESREARRIYAPYTTGETVFGLNRRVDAMIMINEGTDEASAKATQQAAIAVVARGHHFDPKDTQAVNSNNNLTNYLSTQGLFKGITVFIWVVGLGTLLAGVIGVSNIMLIIVRERTKEIGIRKAIGATPAQVIGLILQESILITSVAGYIGLAAGVGLLELMNAALSQTSSGGGGNGTGNGDNGGFFQNPSVDIQVALLATGILVAAGALAGLVPARQAARVQPIEALRAD